MIALACLFFIFSFVHVYMVPADEWVDPNDMINFDHVTISNSKKLNKPTPQFYTPDEEMHFSEKKAEPAPQDTKPDTLQMTEGNKLFESSVNESNDSFSDPLNTTQNHTQPIKKKIHQKKHTIHMLNQDKTFYRIFMKKIIDLWSGKKLSENESKKFKATLFMSRVDLDILRKFTASDSGDINDSHDILIKMIKQIDEIRTVEEYVNFFQRYSYVANWVICLACCLSCSIFIIRLRFSVSLKQVIMKLFVCALLISIPMKWYELYKREVAQQARAMMTGPPSGCGNKEVSWWQTLLGVVRSMTTVQTDACIRYHEQMMIDPIFKVSIVEAITMTIMSIVLVPMRDLGEAFGKFLSHTMAPLPHMLYPVPIVLLVIGMFFLSGYSIRLPFLLSVEPSGRRAIRSEDYHSELSDIKANLAKLMASCDRGELPVKDIQPSGRDRGGDVIQNVTHIIHRVPLSRSDTLSVIDCGPKGDPDTTSDKPTSAGDVASKQLVAIENSGKIAACIVNEQSVGIITDENDDENKDIEDIGVNESIINQVQALSIDNDLLSTVAK